MDETKLREAAPAGPTTEAMKWVVLIVGGLLTILVMGIFFLTHHIDGALRRFVAWMDNEGRPK